LSFQVFDVINFDMINMIKLTYVPGAASWVHKAGDLISEIAVAESESPAIHVYDGKGSSEPLSTLNIHMKAVTAMVFSPQLNIVVSSDEAGMVEFWSGASTEYKFPRNVNFESKVETDLYEFAKNKTHVLNMTVSPAGDQVVMMAADRKVRIFR
jgi:peptidylprolyl isomerase domain and WD repeat-containing protein 1